MDMLPHAEADRDGISINTKERHEKQSRNVCVGGRSDVGTSVGADDWKRQWGRFERQGDGETPDQILRKSHGREFGDCGEWWEYRNWNCGASLPGARI